MKDARAADGPGWLGDPMEVAIVQLAAEAMPALPRSPRMSELPFDSQRKRLSTVHAGPEGPLLWPLLARAYLFLGLWQATAAMGAYWFVLRSGGWHFGQSLPAHDPLYLQATTACLSAIVVLQIANVFLCRSDRRSIFATGLFSNKLILAGIAAEILLIVFIVYTPWGNALFGTAPIPAKVWLFILPFALAMVALEELRKWVARARRTARA